MTECEYSVTQRTITEPSDRLLHNSLVIFLFLCNFRVQFSLIPLRFCLCVKFY